MFWIKTENGNYVDISKSFAIVRTSHVNGRHTVQAIFQFSAGVDNSEWFENLRTFTDDIESDKYMRELVKILNQHSTNCRG